MLPVVLALIAAARVFFQSRTDIAVEVLALRQQVAVLKRKRPKPPLCPLDRLFWTVLRTTWSRWKDALGIVKPETVVGWHRAGFRWYWRWNATWKRRIGAGVVSPAWNDGVDAGLVTSHGSPCAEHTFPARNDGSRSDGSAGAGRDAAGWDHPRSSTGGSIMTVTAHEKVNASHLKRNAYLYLIHDRDPLFTDEF